MTKRIAFTAAIPKDQDANYLNRNCIGESDYRYVYRLCRQAWDERLRLAYTTNSLTALMYAWVDAPASLTPGERNN